MSCCFGITFFNDKKSPPREGAEDVEDDVDDDDDVYIRNDSIRPLLNVIHKTAMSTTTDTMRVPHIPISTRDLQPKIPMRKPKEIERTAFSRNRKVSSPTSSAENFHMKASSSDSSTSREEVSEANDHEPVRIRARPDPSSIPATACYNFEAGHTDEISFTRGSKVIVRRKHSTDDEYVLVEVNGKCGLAPKQFLQPRGITPPTIELGFTKEKLEFNGKRLGHGTFANVYEVVYKNKKYALKVMKEESDEKALQEAECLNGLDHPNIVRVFGICYTPVSILLELCEGGQLVDLLKKPGFNPPVRILLKWARQIAEALQYMHNQEIPICHCDLKPQNIIILEKPCICDSTNYHNEDCDQCSTCGYQRLSRLTLKLTDFGLAKPETNGRISLVGSTPYMSPEYIQTNHMTPKADVWSYGVLLWEIFTKETPYQDLAGYDLMAICFGIGQYELHLDIDKICSFEMKNLLHACWKPDPTERPTMEEVINMIENIPTNKSEYVLVGGPTKNTRETNQSVIEKLKSRLSNGLWHFDKPAYKPQPPPRKLTRADIGAPTDYKPLVSVKEEEGGLAFIDHEEDRCRHKSSHENAGTLPREAHRGNLRAGISTPELHNTGLDSPGAKTLERKPAMRRKGGSNKGAEQLVTSCLPNSQHKTSVVLGSSTTPCHDTNPFNFVDVEVIENPAMIKVPRKTRESQRSNSSNSTFYLDQTSPSESYCPSKYDASPDSTLPKKSKTKALFNKIFPTTHKEPTSNYAVYDPETHRYCKRSELAMSNNYTHTPHNLCYMSPSAHLQTVNLAQYIRPATVETPTTSHFQKFQNTPMKQRRQKITEHRRNPSNTSERQYNTNNSTKNGTPTSTAPKSPSFHHSSSEGASMSSSHLSVANCSPSRSSVINFGTVLPLPASSSPTTFPVSEDSFSPRDHRNRAFTSATLSTEIPEPSAAPPPPILHPRSRSTDISNINQGLALLMNNQLIAENLGYCKSKPDGRQGSETSPVEVPHYIALKNTIPTISHGKQKSADHAAPPLPPHSAHKSTFEELPKSQAPILHPRTFHAPPKTVIPEVLDTPGYISLESARSSTVTPSSDLAVNPHYVHTHSSPGNLSDLQSSAEPVQRPDTLPGKLRNDRIQRNSDAYVRLIGQLPDDSEYRRIREGDTRVPRILPYLHQKRPPQ